MKSGLRETIAAESLSVVNLLIEEVFARKKRSAGGDQFQDQEDERDSDDFLFSQPFLDLFSKVARRSSEILSKTTISNSNLAYQLTSFISNCVNFKNNQVVLFADFSWTKHSSKVMH